MLRSLSRAMILTALVAAPASAQFGGSGSASFDPSILGGQGQLTDGISASTGLTQIDIQPTVDVVPTPEPASMALLATGLVGVLSVVRRKRNARL